MTTTTWTAAPITSPAPQLASGGLRMLKAIGHVFAIGLGVYAEQDSAFRGLDLNGNAVWAKPARH